MMYFFDDFLPLDYQTKLAGLDFLGLKKRIFPYPIGNIYVFTSLSLNLL